MLQNIRDNSQGLIAKFIIGLIIIPFALFGIDSLVGGGGPVKVATVNGEDIVAVELEQALNSERRRRLNMMGENVDPTLLDENALRGPVLEQLIQQRLLLQSAQDSVIGISPQIIDQTIISLPQFQENGQFSSILYQNVLRSNGYTTAYFKQLIAKDMLISQLNSGVAGSDFITQKELEDVARIIGQKRSFRYLTMPGDKVAAQVVVSNEETQQYYDENIANFQTEDLLRLNYIELKRKDFFKPVAIEKLQEAYELEMASYQFTEERRAAHILIEVKDDRNEEQVKQLLNELSDKLAGGESFASLAESYSDDLGSAQNAGDLGYTSGDTFPPEFEQALAGLQLNQVSSPVKTDAGYHLIKVTDIKSGEKPSFADRESIITQRIQTAAADVELVKVVENLRDLVFNSEGLSGPAEELGLAVSNSGLIGRSSAQAALANPQVLAAAFSNEVLEEGNNSEVIELASDHFIVVNVVEHQPPRAKALDDVKAGIVAQLTQRKSTALTQELANQAMVQLSEGKTMAELAEKGGYEWQIVDAVTRNSATANRDILISAFSMPQAKSANREIVTLANGSVVILQLEDVIDGSWQQFTVAEQRGIRSELERNASSKSLDRFLGSLRDHAEINIL